MHTVKNREPPNFSSTDPPIDTLIFTMDPTYTETVHPQRLPVCSVARATSVGQGCYLEHFKGTIPVGKLMIWYRTSAECPGDAIVVEVPIHCSAPRLLGAECG